MNLPYPAPAQVLIPYTVSGTANASDHTLTSGTLTIGMGQSIGSIAFNITDDATPESNETVIVTLGVPIGGVLGPNISHVVNIQDNDSGGGIPTIAIANVSLPEGTASPSTMTFTVTSSAPAPAPITVNYTASAGSAIPSSDYTLTPGTLTIGTGQTSANILVNIINDATSEGNETFTITLSAGSGYTAAGSQLVATGTITDDDGATPPTLSVADVTAVENGTNMTFVITASSSWGSNITVDYATTATTATSGADYIATGGTATIPSGATLTNIVVPLVNDSTSEPTETFQFNLSNGLNYTAAGSDLSAIGTINDDDSGLGAFSISGVTGGSDSTQDPNLNTTTYATINWNTSAGAVTYDVSIYQNDGTTIQCALVNTAATSFNFSSCGLTQGQTYKAKVTARDGSSGTLDATNTMFPFFVNRPPVISASTIEIVGSPFTINVTGVATDPDSGDTVTISNANTPSIGTVSSFNASSISYSFALDIDFGVATMNVTVQDSRGGTASGSINMRIVYPYTWVGGGVDSNWSTASNWYSGTAPTTGAKVFFDSACGANCNATINQNIDVDKIEIGLGYSGTITQQSGWTVTLTNGYFQRSGTFTGGTNAILAGGNFVVQGGTFVSTTGTLKINGDITISSPGTLNHNNGLLEFNSATTPRSYSMGYVNVNNVNFIGNQASIFAATTLNILGALDVNKTAGVIDGATLNLQGNLTYRNAFGGTAVIRLNGSGTQDINSVVPVTTATSGLPNFELNKPGGTVNFYGSIAFKGSFSHTSGSVNSYPASVLYFNAGANSTPLNFSYAPFLAQVVKFQGNFSQIITGTLQSTSLYIDKTSMGLNGGTIRSTGNIDILNLPNSSTVALETAGSTGGMISAGPSATYPKLTFNHTACTFSLAGTLSFAGDLIHTTGAVDTSGTIVRLVGSGSRTVYASSLSFQVLEINVTASTIDFGGSNLNVMGNLMVNATSSSLNNGQISAYGNASFSGVMGGSTASFMMSGATAATLSLSSGSIPGTNVIISKTGTVTLSSGINLQPNQSLTLNSGDLNLAGFSLTLPSGTGTLTLTPGTSITRSGGTITVSGSNVGPGPYGSGNIY